MAKHNREFFTCDICGVVMDAPHRGSDAGTYTLKASSDYAVTGHSMNWSDLCGPCNSWLGRMISDLEEHSKQARKITKQEQPQ